MLIDALVEAILGDGAVRHVGLGINLEICLLRHVLKQVTQAQDNDLMPDNQHAAAAVVERDRIERASQAQDNVAPAFPLAADDRTCSEDGGTRLGPGEFPRFLSG